MAMRDVFVVLTRDKGLFLVEPRAGMNQRDTIEAALGFGGGYSAGKVQVDLPEGATEAWAAWVTGDDPQGRPYFFMRAFDPSLAQDEVERLIAAEGEEWVKLNRSPIYQPDRPIDHTDRDAVEFQP
ncbi:MAG TPA: hypothetical protein VK464_19545 [Symbiobacteriaceae bacterium]|jgi:hypothetical protein|nr:hypothetical protein [Symbiobacteriaceae bacterium]